MKKTKVFGSPARFFLLLATVAVMAVPSLARAATIVVTSSADSGVNTLRAAITAAAAGDTIDFNLGSDQVITLASTLPTINKNLTIQNTSSFNVTVSGNFAVRVFQITAGTVNIRDINIAAGRTTTASTHGAGILVQNAGTTLNLTNTAFFSNVTAGGADGGALQNEGATVNILNSTFSNNAASGFGGAIDNSSGTINISFTTIIGNTSNVDTSSAANGGGVFNASGGTLRIKNSILANNNALVSSGPECASANPNAITSLGGNVIFNPAGCGNLNIPGGAKPDITFVSPVTGPLQDNGGLTLTHGLLAGSPAIDSADCVVPGGQPAFFACPGTDQIATTRPQGGGFDRGSFEFKLAGAAGQVDLQVDNRVDNSTPTVGNTINYTVSVLNKGPNPAANLRMTAFFDPGLTINSVTPSGIGGTAPVCSISNSVVICTNGTLAANLPPLTPPYSAQYVINATVNSGGPISAHASVIDLTNQDPDPSNNSDTAEINSAGAAGPSADLSITKTVDKPLSSIGDTVVFTMAVHNGGTSNATGVSVRDFISGPFTLVGNTASGGCSTLSSSNGLELLCNVGTINNGATTTFTITGTVATGAFAGQAGQVDNTATVYAGANASDPNLENNIAIASTVVQAAASTQIDLGIVKYVSEPMSTVGDALDFTIGVINNSLTTDAQNVVVRDVITGPYALDVVFNDFPGDCTSTTIGTGAIELICNVGNLPANGPYQFFHIFGIAGPSLFNIGQVDNIATIYDPADPTIPYGGSEDPNPSNNSAVASSVVQAPDAQVADLSITKTVDKPQSFAGDTITFTIVVHNDGPDNAFGVKVRDFASGPFTYVSDTAPGLGGCSPTAATNGTELICNVGEVDSGTDVTFTVTGTVDAGGQVDNTATVYDTTIVLNDAFVRATFDPITANNVAVASTVVVEPVCGDGLQEGSEQCDDGANNGVPGDPCDATCHLVPVCGDGILEGTEQCDDGNTTPGDGCSATCRVEGVDLSIVKTVDQATAVTGSTVHYTLTVKNNELLGGRSASNVVVNDLHSGPLSNYQNLTTSAGSCDPAANPIHCTIGAMAPQAEVTIEYDADIGLGQIDNIASVDDTDNPVGPVPQTQDPNTTNNSAVASVIGFNAGAPSVDLSVVKSVNVGQAVVGTTDAVTFTITVNNPDTTNAPTVHLTDTFGMAAGAFTMTGSPTFTTGGGSCGGSLPTLTCDINSFSGGQAVITITGTLNSLGQVDNHVSVADTTGNSQDPDFTNNSSTASVIGVNAGAPNVDLSVIKSVNVGQAVVGTTDAVTFTITVNNPDTTNAPTVHLTDTFGMAAGAFTMTGSPSFTVGGGSCSGSLPSLTCDIDTWSGNQAVITITGTINSLGQIDNHVSVADTTGGTQDSNLTNNNSTASVIGVQAGAPNADLSVVKSVSAGQVVVGNTVTFTVDVSNAGSTPGNVHVTDTFGMESGAFTLGSATVTTGTGTCSSTLPSLTCDITALATNKATITITGTVNKVGQIDNHASVTDDSGTTVDPDLSNNNSTASVVGVNANAPVVDLSVTKSVNNGQATVGVTDAVTFTITVNNPDTTNAPTVHLTDNFGMAPGAFTMTGSPAFTTGGGSCSGAVPTLTCDIDTWSGGQAVITITGTLNDVGQVDNHVSVADTTGGSQDSNPTNNNATASVVGVSPAAPAVDLSVTKSVNVGQATVGVTDAVTFTVTVNNPDTTNAPSVHVTDSFGMAPGAFTMTGSPTFTTGGGSCSGSLPTLTCDINSFSGGQAVFTITGTLNAVGQVDDHVSVADITGGTIDPDFTNNATVASVIGVQAGAPSVDLSVTKSVNVGQAIIGTTDAVTFTITVNNPDTTNVPSVHLTDSFGMAGGAFTMTGSPSFTTGGGSCSGSLPTLTCDIDTFATGQAVITITGTINSLGQIDNHVSVADTTGGSQDPNFTNNAAVASVIGVSPAAPSVDLSVTKSVNVGQAVIGTTDAVTFTITVNNPDTTNAPTVHLTDSFGMAPGAFTMTGSPSFTTGGGSCSGSLPTLTCDIDTFATGQAVITITGTINSVGQIDNHVSVADTTGGTQDPNFTNNAATASVIGINPAVPQTDLSLTKVVDLAHANINDTVTFKVTVTNTDSTNTADGVRITDIAVGPMQVQTMAFTTGTGTCTPSLTLPASAQPFLSFICIPTNGKIAPGVTVEMTMTAKVTGEGQIDNTASADVTVTQDPDHSNNTAMASVNGTSNADLKVTKTLLNGPNFNIGDTVNFEIEIENLGPNDATNVTLTDMQLGGLSFDTPAPAGCTINGNNMTCDVTPLLASGASITIDYSSTANLDGLWSNIVTVSSDVEDHIMSNNTTSANVSVGVAANTANLAVTKTADVTEVKQGGDIHYTVVVTNNGPDDAANVVLNDFIAGPFGSVSNIQITPAGTCNELNGLITCTVPSLPHALGFNTVTITYTVTSSDPGSISNLAVVSGSVLDPDQSDNSAAYQVQVFDSLADLSITKSVNPNPGLTTGEFTYNVLVKNAGPDTAKHAVVVDQLAGKFSGVTATPSTGSCTTQSDQPDTTTVICDLGDLAKGAQATITIKVMGNGLGSILSNLAAVYSDTHDPLLGNNVATADTNQGQFIPPPTPTPTPTPFSTLEGHGAFAKVGGCDLQPGSNSPVPWTVLLVLATATAWVLVNRRRVR